MRPVWPVARREEVRGPRLTVAKIAPAQALLQWPTNYSGFMLESALSLDAGGLWRPFTNVATVNGAVFSVSVGTTNAAQCFRLRKP